MKKWQPCSQSELEQIITTQLSDCSLEQQSYFDKVRVPLYTVKISRLGFMEDVFVIAKKELEVIYYEDVEEGFNISPINNKGELLENYCDQFELKHMLYRWMNNLTPLGNKKDII